MSASPAFTKTDLAVCDPVWSRVRDEAEEVLRTEPQLASLMVATILNHPTLEGPSRIASPPASGIRPCRRS